MFYFNRNGRKINSHLKRNRIKLLTLFTLKNYFKKLINVLVNLMLMTETKNLFK